MRGRGAEFETVLGLLDGMQQGQGRVLLVEGEPGAGNRCCWPGRRGSRPHTVAFHLRECSASSTSGRVHLARIALEHARPEAARKPHDWGM
jgi:hypothetical protein